MNCFCQFALVNNMQKIQFQTSNCLYQEAPSPLLYPIYFTSLFYHYHVILHISNYYITLQMRSYLFSVQARFEPRNFWSVAWPFNHLRYWAMFGNCLLKYVYCVYGRVCAFRYFLHSLNYSRHWKNAKLHIDSRENHEKWT